MKDLKGVLVVVGILVILGFILGEANSNQQPSSEDTYLGEDIIYSAPETDSNTESVTVPMSQQAASFVSGLTPAKGLWLLAGLFVVVGMIAAFSCGDRVESHFVPLILGLVLVIVGIGLLTSNKLWGVIPLVIGLLFLGFNMKLGQ